MNTKISTDVCVLWWGIAGTMLSKKASNLGYKTVLLEQNTVIGAWPSTKNEWWLHRWTYHAQSIANENQALQVAGRCIYGHEQVRTYAPEAIEDPISPGYAIIQDVGRYEYVLDRWRKAGVSFEEVSPNTLIKLEPTVKSWNIGRVFKVKDLWINTRMLFARLLHDFQSNWGKIMLGHTVSIDKQTVSTSTWVDIEARLFIYCIWYGVKNFFKENFQVDIPLRLWKSHLLVTPRVTNNSVFYLDPWEAWMMNHWKTTVFWMNEDAFIVEKYDTTPVLQNISNIRWAIQKAFSLGENYPHQPIACIKVDFAPELRSPRSLGIAITEPLPGHIIALPGKMTETPYMTDMLTQTIFERLWAPNIAKRPLDEFIEKGYNS